MISFALPPASSGGGSGGGPGSDTTAARLTDPRFYGIERIDLRAKYSAPLDGLLHPLSSMGLSAAQALYPNIGLTGSTNLSTFAQDTAAWLQAEYDLRIGAGGIIGLPDGGQMNVSRQLWLQNATKVWFHGGRNNTLFTAGAGTAAPAIRISNGLNNALALRNFFMFAKASRVSPSGSGGGVPHTDYVAGAQAFAIDNCQGTVFSGINWNGYDQPFQWGDNTYGIIFEKYGASGCNAGISWSQTTGLNSMERIYFQSGATANNNYGFDINATFGSYPQGGSITISDSAIDYNIVRQGRYIGAPVGNTYCNNSLLLQGNYIETTGVCSGTSLCRIYSQGILSVVGNHLFENDGGVPPGFIEVADNTVCSVIGNPVNGPVPALMWSSTSNAKYVEASGNRAQYMPNRPIALRDGTGDRLQPARDDGDMMEVYDDNNSSQWARMYGKVIGLYFFNGPGSFSLPNDSTFAFPVGYCMQVVLQGAGAATQAIYPGEGSSHAVTIAGASGVEVLGYPGLLLSTAGQRGYLHKTAPNRWRCVIPAVDGGSGYPVTVVSASGASQSLAWPARGRATYDITLTANCTLTLTGTPPSGEEAEIVLYLRQDSTAGRVATLPSVIWPNGIAPAPNTAAGVVDRFLFRTPDAGATKFGGY